MTFQLDTSGAVNAYPEIMGDLGLQWPDLPAFTQGYVSALFASIPNEARTFEAFKARGYKPAGFAHLAPETLATIIEDCARIRSLLATSNTMTGAQFWANCQISGYTGSALFDFPPLQVCLSDDGKVRFK